MSIQVIADVSRRKVYRELHREETISALLTKVLDVRS